jgi:hypothetical protein
LKPEQTEEGTLSTARCDGVFGGFQIALEGMVGESVVDGTLYE